VNANFRNSQLPGNNPFANVLVVVIGAIAIAISFVIGVVALVALAAAVIVLGAIIGIRVWWLGVKSRKRAGQQPHDQRVDNSQSSSNAVIEGEYHVIAGKKDDGTPPRT
jgi:hypothetical protein